MRIQRAASNVVTALSLVAIVPVGLLWWRSITVCDTIAWRSANGPWYGISTHPNGIGVYRTDTGNGGTDPDGDGRRPGLGPAWSSLPYGKRTPIVVPRPKARGNMVFGASGYEETRWVRPSHWFAGFGWDDRTYAAGPPLVTSPTSTRWRTVELPFAAAVACCGATPALRLVRTVVRRRRQQVGRCQACGYDLRATPGRCPECGRSTVA